MILRDQRDIVDALIALQKDVKRIKEDLTFGKSNVRQLGSTTIINGNAQVNGDMVLNSLRVGYDTPIYLDGTDTTYRLWVGDTSAVSAINIKLSADGTLTDAFAGIGSWTLESLTGDTGDIAGYGYDATVGHTTVGSLKFAHVGTYLTNTVTCYMTRNVGMKVTSGAAISVWVKQDNPSEYQGLKEKLWLHWSTGTVDEIKLDEGSNHDWAQRTTTSPRSGYLTKVGLGITADGWDGGYSHDVWFDDLSIGITYTALVESVNLDTNQTATFENGRVQLTLADMQALMDLATDEAFLKAWNEHAYTQIKFEPGTGSGSKITLVADEVYKQVLGGTAYSLLSSNDATATPTANKIPIADASGNLASGWLDAMKLDDLASPDDNTDLNASASKHGLLPKLSNVATEVLSGIGTWISQYFAFTKLTDVPSAYTGLGGKVLKVKSTEDGIEAVTETTGSIAVQEVDGNPNVTGVTRIKVTNGSLTDDGSGTVTLDFGSASTDGAAIHDDTASEIHAITEKISLADDDEFIIEDSADGYSKKRVKKSNLPSGGGAGDVTWSVIQASQLCNEVMNYPAMVGIDIDLVAMNQWWDSVDTPTTACTMVDLAGEAGITETWGYALKCVTDASGEGLYQRYTYADQPRIKSGRKLSALVAVWVGTAGRTVTMKLITSASTEVSATATAQAWTIIKCENLTLDGSYVDMQFTIDGADTFYVVPLGVNIGAKAVPLKPRGSRIVYPTPASVKTLTGLGDEATWTDVDITANASPITFRAKLRMNILHTNATGWDFGLRRNGTSFIAGLQTYVTALPNTNDTTRSFAENDILLDDGQIFEYYLDRWAGSSTLYEGNIMLIAYEEWE